jgi:hypothetical protein
VVATISVIYGILWVAVGLPLSPGCANEVLAEYPSPARQNRLVVFERDCGATTGFSTQASLLPISASLDNEGGNVFDADTDHDKSPSGAGGGPELRVEWRSENSLILTHHSLARIFKAERRFLGVDIVYKKESSQ